MKGIARAAQKPVECEGGSHYEDPNKGRTMRLAPGSPKQVSPQEDPIGTISRGRGNKNRRPDNQTATLVS